jgi:hypothetical protein
MLERKSSALQSPLKAIFQQLANLPSANNAFGAPPASRTTSKKSLGTKTKQSWLRVSVAVGVGFSQEPKTKSPAWCEALSA